MAIVNGDGFFEKLKSGDPSAFLDFVRKYKSLAVQAAEDHVGEGELANTICNAAFESLQARLSMLESERGAVALLLLTIRSLATGQK